MKLVTQSPNALIKTTTTNETATQSSSMVRTTTKPDANLAATVELGSKSTAPARLYFLTVAEPTEERADGAIDIDSFIKGLEADPKFAEGMRDARRWLVDEVGGNRRTFRSLRLAAGLSQAQLAELLGTSQPYIARLEKGGVDPVLSTVSRLAKALNIEEIEMFSILNAHRVSGK